MNLSNLWRLGALIFLLTSVSSARADGEALSAIATLACDELGYNNLSRNSQGDAPFGIPLRQWDQGAVSSIYDRIRACLGEIDPVQARLALQQGSRFLDGIVRRAASARAGAQRDVALMEAIQRNLADVESSTLPPAQILSKLDGVQAGVQAVSRALPPDIRDAFQRRIDAKRAALTAVLQVQAEREQKAAEDRLASLRAAANTPATPPPPSPLTPPPSGDAPSPTRSSPPTTDPSKDPKIAEARRRTQQAQAETARLQSDLRRKQIEADVTKLDHDELDLYNKTPAMKDPEYLKKDNPEAYLSILYAAEVMFRVCKERTTEFNADIPRIQHESHVIEGVLVKLEFISDQEVTKARSNVGLNGGSNEIVDRARATPDIVEQCREMASTLGMSKPLAQ